MKQSYSAPDLLVLEEVEVITGSAGADDFSSDSYDDTDWRN